MKRRLTSLILAAVLCLALAIPAAAAEYKVLRTYYDWGHYFSEGLAAVELDGKWGYIDKNGDMVIPLKYDYASDFSEGLAAVELDGKRGYMGYINKNEDVVIPIQYEYALDFSEGLAAVMLGGKYGYISKNGDTVIPFQYDNTSFFSEGLAKVELNGKWGFIDKTGSIVIPCQHDWVGNFSEGLAIVKMDGKYGFIDKTGKLVVPCIYQEVKDYSEGLAAVKSLYSRWGYIDKNGKVVIPIQYVSAEAFSEGLAAVRLDRDETTADGLVAEVREYGYIDRTGKVIIPHQYWYAKSFSEGLAFVVNNNGKEDGYIDKNGRIIIPRTFSEGWPVREGTMLIGTGKYYYYIVLKSALPATVTRENIPASGTAYASRQTIELDGKKVELPAYALKDANGNDTNYVRVRDLAALLNGTAGQFDVNWAADRGILLTGRHAYEHKNGTEGSIPFSGNQSYAAYTENTYVNDAAQPLTAFVITYQNGGHTYYKLRDLGKVLGFNVGWTSARGMFIETDKPYTDAD